MRWVFVLFAIIPSFTGRLFSLGQHKCKNRMPKHAVRCIRGLQAAYCAAEAAAGAAAFVTACTRWSFGAMPHT